MWFANVPSKDSCREKDCIQEERMAREQINIVFFGGEPLTNVPLIREVVDYAEAAVERAGKRIDFSLTTNATLLNAGLIEYFDAHLIGLTATPTKQTFGFFRQNLVMEYSHEMAVADGVNVINFSISGGSNPFTDPVELAHRIVAAAGDVASGAFASALGSAFGSALARGAGAAFGLCRCRACITAIRANMVGPSCSATSSSASRSTPPRD